MSVVAMEMGESRRIQSGDHPSLDVASSANLGTEAQSCFIFRLIEHRVFYWTYVF